MEKFSLLLLLSLCNFFSLLSASSNLIPDDSNKGGLKCFRISNTGASYDHESTDNYYQLILERSKLYSMLLEISSEIEAVNLDNFADSLERNKENIGFCARFHIIFLILNRYSRSDPSSEPSTFVEMIRTLSRLEINEFPTEISYEQFEAFSERVSQIIIEFQIKGPRDAILADALKRFLEFEILLLNSLSV